MLGARPGEITFTSGGTESDNAAVKGIALAEPRGRHIVISAVEHPAVLESAAFLGRTGFEITTLGVDHDGRVSPDDLAAALRDDTTLVSIQLANNEVGTVQPIAELAALAGARGIPFHTDAVQAAGWLDLDVTRLGVQALSISGHKLGAPKGVGVLYMSRRTPSSRSSTAAARSPGAARAPRTSPVPWARGGPATGIRPADDVVARRDAFIARVESEVPGAVLTGHRTERLPGSASFVFPGTSGESILLDLERRGIVCSSGSACAAGSDEPSHVLTAMGYDREVAQTAVRFTFGRATTDADLAEAADALSPSCRPTRLRRRDQPALVGEHDRLYAVAQAELHQDPGDVGLHGVLGDEQRLGDLGVGQAARDLPQHLGLTFGQPVD